jgi:tripartite-type tricarboxylate transporter receptor subunit TctC
MCAHIRRVVCSVAGAVLLMIHAMPNAAAAESAYPSRPIRLVLPFPPGGGIDALARLLTPKLSAAMGQQWVVDNRTGAAGNVAIEIVAKAAPDGHTALLALSTILTVNPLLYKNLPFDVLRDLKPVTQVGSAQYVLVVPPSLGATTVKELIAIAKAKPGQLNYASSGVGGIQHFVTELFKTRTGTDFVHVPYKGGGPATAAVLSGEAHLLFGSVASVVPQVKAGRLRALGVSSRKRSPAVPDVPTLHEEGITNFDVTTWYGLLVPAQTPDAIVRRLHQETVAALQMPDVREAMSRQGQEVVTGSPPELSALIKRELAANAEIVKKADIRPE